MNINAYHQPGVEAGKKAAASVLDLQSRVETLLETGTAQTIAEINQAMGEDREESIFWILRHLVTNDRGYRAEGDWSKPTTLRFSRG